MHFGVRHYLDKEILNQFYPFYLRQVTLFYDTLHLQNLDVITTYVLNCNLGLALYALMMAIMGDRNMWV
jgi:hypothetical protein